MHNRQSPHGDHDYLGEAVDLVNNFDVERVYFNEGELNGNEKKVISSLSKDTNYFISYEGSFYEVGDFRFSLQ